MSNILATAKKYLGMTETGNKTALSAYFKKAGFNLDPSTTAWCAGFANSVLHECGINGTKSLAARSFLNWGRKVEPRSAQPGDIVVFKRGNSNWQGHVTFFSRWQGSNMVCLGGNQSDKVCEQLYSTASLLGVRRA